VIVPFSHVGGGVLEPLQLLPAFLALAAYWVRSRTLASEGRPVPGWRMACFGGGIAVIIAALATPVAHIGEELVLGHMAQHLLMADLGSLLLVIGLTGPLLQPLLALRVVQKLRFLAYPVVAFTLWALDLFVWHLPVLYQASISSDLVHALQHMSFVFFGFTMWLALLGPLPQPAWFGNGAKLAYVVAVRLTGTLLANVFMWSEAVFYPDYRSGELEWNIGALQDQGLAGTIMMIEGSLVTVLLLGWLFIKAARESDERQELLEFASAHGVALTEQRAARAVAAGRGEELRRRVESGGAAV
jgi:putative membrane protein